MKLQTALVGDMLKIIIDGDEKFFIIQRADVHSIRCSNMNKKDTPNLLSISLFKKATNEANQHY